LICGQKKSGNNAFISWEPPQISSGSIKEYCVYLSVKQANANDNSGSFSFINVYSGQETSCTVTADVLEKAYVDTLNKPAILFRIAAKNEKGFGPATQVRWLQQAAESESAAVVKRASSVSSEISGAIKKKKE
jgi:host cell factor